MQTSPTHACDLSGRPPFDDSVHEFGHREPDGRAPAALARQLPGILRVADSLAPAERLDWLSELRGAWERAPEAFPPEARRQLIELAAAWCFWPFALEVADTLLPTRHHDAALLDRRTEALYRMGEIDAAIDTSVSLQLAHPTHAAHAAHAARHRDLLAWRDWRATALPVHTFAHDDPMLRLEPLGHHHLDDFRWQYHDPAIAELCCLPHFGCDREWHEWVNMQHRFGDNPCAVIHRAWGFIGSVGLALYRGVGCVHYWLGRDFQGCGFGADAVAILLAAAHRHAGMHACYAKVFEYNTPSRRTLEKLGFVDTGIRGAAPHDDQLFYRSGAPVDEARIAEELHALLDDLDSEVRAAIPLRG